MATQAHSTQTHSTQTTANQAFPSATALPHGSKHGFFKTLPRELRDKVYDLLVQDVFGELGDTKDSFTYRIIAPLVALRLVSHQFKLEYDERCSRNQRMSRLLIEDCTLSLSGVANIYGVPALATRTTNMTLVLNVCTDRLHNTWGYCYAGISPERYVRLIDHFTGQLPYLRCVHVFLMAPRDSCAHTILQKLSHSTMHSTVVELKLLRPGCKFAEDHNDNNNIMATWTRQRGLEG